MKQKLFSYDYTLISKYRDILMGVGILGVMLSHYFRWSGMDGGVVTLALKPFIGLVYTEGFLFLSGFGLYYSFTRNADKRVFWLKRVNRLMIPFALMYLPFGIYKMAVGGATL